MFCTDLREKHEQCVNIQGIDAEDMKMLLDYTYTSKVHITENNVQKTLEAANLFQVCYYSVCDDNRVCDDGARLTMMERLMMMIERVMTMM